MAPATTTSTSTTIADIHQQSISASPIHLMHLAVAYHAPELVTLDAIIARPSAMTSFPTEILLQVRSHLLPSLVQDVHSQGTSALTAFEDAGAQRLCGECIEYNEQVFGTSVWEWPNFVDGCDCPRNGERPVRSAPARAICEKAPRCRREWLQGHLSTKMRPTRPIWEAVEAMLETVDCNVTDLSACAHEATETRVCVLPRPEAPSPSAALRRAQMEFGLGGPEVPAPLEQQEAGMPFITPAKTEPLVSPAADNGPGVLFGTVGLGMFGVAIALSTVSEKIVSLPRSLLKADKTAAALACAAGLVVAVRIGATFA